jgi:hypothetical protein
MASSPVWIRREGSTVEAHIQPAPIKNERTETVTRQPLDSSPDPKSTRLSARVPKFSGS